MLDVLFSRWVLIHLSLHESKAKVLGMPSPEMQKNWIYFMLSNNKFLGKCWYGGHPWIRLAMESESMMEKGINFIFYLGTAYDISSMESVGNSKSFLLVGTLCLPKCFLSLSFSLWALAPLQIPTSLREGPFFYFLLFLFLIWVSIFSYKAPTRGHYDRTWALGVVNMRVCFMNGSMIEHDGLGITYFSVDILKDMVACWYAWVFKSHVKTRLLLWTI